MDANWAVATILGIYYNIGQLLQYWEVTTILNWAVVTILGSYYNIRQLLLESYYNIGQLLHNYDFVQKMEVYVCKK